MGSHAAGSGTTWQESNPDVDQPHGLDYRELQDIRKGVRKRIEQEHATFADATVGGIHNPGECAILGIADGTPGNTTTRGRGIIWDSSSRLWCNTDTAGVSTAYAPVLLTLDPDLQSGGADITWTGEHQFEASVAFLTKETEFSKAAHFDESVDISGALDCSVLSVDGSADFSDVGIVGDLTVGDTTGDTLRVAGDVSLAADGTATSSPPRYGQFTPFVADTTGEIALPGKIALRWGCSSQMVDTSAADYLWATLGFNNYTTTFQVFASPYGNNNYVGCVGVYGVSAEGFSLKNDTGVGGAGNRIMWWAVGEIA